MKRLIAALLAFGAFSAQAAIVDFEGHFLFCDKRANIDVFLNHMVKNDLKGIQDMGEKGQCMLIPTGSVQAEHGNQQPIFNTEHLYYQATTLHYNEQTADGWSLAMGAVHNSGKSE